MSDEVTIGDGPRPGRHSTRRGFFGQALRGALGLVLARPMAAALAAEQVAVPTAIGRVTYFSAVGSAGVYTLSSGVETAVLDSGGTLATVGRLGVMTAAGRHARIATGGRKGARRVSAQHPVRHSGLSAGEPFVDRTDQLIPTHATEERPPLGGATEGKGIALLPNGDDVTSKSGVMGAPLDMGDGVVLSRSGLRSEAGGDEHDNHVVPLLTDMGHLEARAHGQILSEGQSLSPSSGS